MRAFIAAISFACMLAVASNMAVTNYNLAPVVQAQGDGNWLIVSKSVQGAIPESDWQEQRSAATSSSTKPVG